MPAWMTREREELQMTDMQPGHLINALNMRARQLHGCEIRKTNPDELQGFIDRSLSGYDDEVRLNEIRRRLIEDVCNLVVAIVDKDYQLSLVPQRKHYK